MNPELQIAVIASTSALVGSLIGGAVSYFTTIASTKISWVHTQLEKQIDSLVKLHGEFLEEVGRITLLAIDTKLENTSTFVKLHTMVARIRLLSDKSTVQAAIEVVTTATGCYSPLKESRDTAIEMHRTHVNNFCECSRKEIQKLRERA
jgi:uncharacterized Zn ribbon protein